MTTLLLRLCGPMQSWGTESRFELRGTGLEPSKSGVVGILAAALGRERKADLSDLASLHMGVRVLRPGVLCSDFHTVGGILDRKSYGVPRFDGSAPKTIVTQRHYLADADFLVGMEGDGVFLAELDHAVRHPHWPLCLGRKAYIPSLPVALPDSGVSNLVLRKALLAFPWPEGVNQTRCIYDDPDGDDQRHDLPVSFAWGQSRYVMRQVRSVLETREEV